MSSSGAGGGARTPPPPPPASPKHSKSGGGLFAGLHVVGADASSSSLAPSDNNNHHENSIPTPPPKGAAAYEQTPKLDNTSRQRVIPSSRTSATAASSTRPSGGGVVPADLPITPTLDGSRPDTTAARRSTATPDDDNNANVEIAPSGSSEVTSAPVTDKLLGLLGTAQAAEAPEQHPGSPPPQPAPAAAAPKEQPTKAPEQAPAPATTTSSYGGMFSSWFGGGGGSSSKPEPAAPKPPQEPAAPPRRPVQKKEEESPPDSEPAVTPSEEQPESSPKEEEEEQQVENATTTKDKEEEAAVPAPEQQVDKEQASEEENHKKKKQVADTKEPNKEQEEQSPKTPPKKKMSQAEQSALDAAFEHSDSKPSSIGGGSEMGDDNQEAAAAPATPAAATAPPPPPSEEESEEPQVIASPAAARLVKSTSSPAAAAAAAADSPQKETPPSVQGIAGRVHPDTPIPNCDAALRLLRRFAHKTRPKIVTTYDGTKARSFLSYFGLGVKTDPTFVPYRRLMDCLYEQKENGDHHAAAIMQEDDSDRVVDAVMGLSGDSMARARLAVAAFVDLFSTWGHASSSYFEEKNAKAQQAFSELMSAVFEAASQLVAHGCLDGVLIGFARQQQQSSSSSADDTTTTAAANNNMDYQRAVHMLAQSVFNADLSIERNELSAMKFLLGTGCRVGQSGDALLRGSHLLQTIRTLYHVYLTTESSPNKTTARAALQQLTTSVFSRVASTTAGDDGVMMDEMSEQAPPKNQRRTRDNFPTENHRDAFLVLRSICKLSMRAIPDSADSTGGSSGGGNSMIPHNHVGLQSSGSHDTWDESNLHDPSMSSPRGLGGGGHRGSGMDDGSGRGAGGGDQHHAQLLYTSALHPALESKLLALELILYVLQNTQFTKGFIQKSGPQFQAAVRNYLCVSLLKNCTSDNTRVVNLSLRIFVPLVRYFRTILKSEIEAFVTNVFFVILDSKNSPAEHKSIVVKTFDEICSDPTTLAEIFLNYDCDLSAVDLFHRIVNTLSTVSRTSTQEPRSSGIFMGSQSVARLERLRTENRELRLNAMKALRQVLASLHASIVEPMSMVAQLKGAPEEDGAAKMSHNGGTESNPAAAAAQATAESTASGDEGNKAAAAAAENGKQNLVEIYGSKKKRRAEEDEIVLRFNRKPSAGIAYAVKCKHIDGDDPADVARYLLKNKDTFDKTQIGEYLGREAEYQNGFSIKVLHEYTRLMDLTDLVFDEAIRFFLSGFRLPGEAQKIDRIMEKFAERFTEQNPDVFPTADVAFILAFSIIMLNTDLHNPAIKEERRMTKEGFIRNNRGICDGQDLPEELLVSIFDRIRENPFSLKEDDEARERVGGTSASSGVSLPPGLSPASFFSSHYDDMDRARESNFQKERDHIVRTTESLLKRRRHPTMESSRQLAKPRVGKTSRQAHRFVRAEDTGLRDEYVSPMFDVAWGPSLAAFSTAMESANGTMGALISVASDEELELAAENAAETIEVCLTGFRFAIGTAGLCGNETARDAYMLALSSFSQLGTGILLEPRHIRCIQTVLRLAREDGELLGSSWEHVFRALSEINRFHQLFHLMARNDRAAAAAAERRLRKLEAKEARKREEERRRAAAEDGESITTETEEEYAYSTDGEDSLAESGLFDEDDFPIDEEGMDARAIDEANARAVYDAVSEGLIEAIYERSSSLSAPAVKDFITQLCLVSRSEISVRGGSNSELQGKAEPTDLTQVSYRQQHVLLSNGSMGSGAGGDQFHHSQPNIYNLQKLVEVTHYNMESRPRLIFSELWAVVADHLTYTALHINPAIAMYAVDSFRQLCIQYLQRDELEVFEFQRRFLKPLETVMARSKQSSTKELLLNCVDRIIQVFAQEDSSKQKGGLRSGWVPILTILGLGGRDPDESVASLSIKILHSAIEPCIEETAATVLLVEHFVETVNALLMCVDGPHDEISLGAIRDLVRLTEFLADESIALPQVKRRSNAPHALERSKQELELWWPILLGLSRTVGDSRMELRTKGLETLDGIVNRHFFPNADGVSCASENADENMQTLQLIFRGILTPILEFAETGTGVDEGSIPPLPQEFDKFLSVTESTPTNPEEAVEEASFASTSWLETTFDTFMDACVSICLRSIKTFHDFSLVDEVFAILNNCLLSDSGSVAVHGLQRLEQFVTSDLDTKVHSDDVWATVCHMLRRCLTVRGLPTAPVRTTGSASEDEKAAAPEEEAQTERYNDAVQDFVAEETLLANRRYVGSNATAIVGLLLTNDHFAITLRWRLFLIAGLGRGIVEWEQAASVLEENSPKKKRKEEAVVLPPDYRETAVFGRKWMNRFLLQLAASEDISGASTDLDPKTNRNAAGQKLVMDETQRLLTRFLDVERAAAEYAHTPRDEALYDRMTDLVKELLTGLQNMGEDHLKVMAWINPILLGSCIQSRNEDVRLAVQRLVQSTTPGSTKPYPSPKKEENTEANGGESSATPEKLPESTAPGAGQDEPEELASAEFEPADAVEETEPDAPGRLVI